MSDSNQFIQEITRIVGSENLSLDDTRNGYAVDGQTPSVVVIPEDSQHVQELLRIAHDKQISVMPRGRGTKVDLGNLAQPIGMALSMEHQDDVLDFAPDDLMVSAQAGCRLSTIQEHVAAAGLFLPLDPVRYEQCTLGGIVATNANGPHRLGYGSVRDLVLGMRVVLADGVAIRVGGSTVKNVAGYDMTKLLVGSLGTLGIITEVIWRLLPLPEESRTLVASFGDIATAFQLCRRIRGSELLPAAMEVTNLAGARSIGYEQALVIVDIEDFAEATNRQVSQIQEWCTELKAAEVAVLQDAEREGLWRKIRDWNTQDIAFRCNLPIASMEGCMAFLENDVPEIQAVAHAGSGVVLARYCSNGDGDEVERLKRFQAHARQLGGYCIAERLPMGVKAHLDVWGYSRQDVALMKGIKRKFDGAGILNRGRFVGGI